MVWDRSKQRSHEATDWELISCPVCGGEDFTLLFRLQEENFVQCDNCGLILINPRPVYAQVLETYDAEYSRGYVKKIASKRRRAARNVRRIRRWVREGRWLDVGCSAGFIIEAAQQMGFEGHGVDVESWGVRYAREQLGLTNARHGSLEAQAYPDGHFNVITAYEVIEHVPDLNAFVAELARILAPDGVMEIRTPDVGHWRTPRRLETWEAVLPSEHLYYFSHTTLIKLLARHGLVVAKRCLNLKPGIHIYVRHSRTD